MAEMLDHQLADQVRHHRSLAADAHARLTGVRPMPAKLVAAAWRHFEARFQRVDASDRAAQIQVAMAAAEAMRAFASLSYNTRLKIEMAETQIERTGYVPSVAAEAEAALADHPVLGPLKAELDREATEWAAEAARREAVNQAAAAARFPAILLERLRRSGLHLALDAKSRLATSANQTIGAADRQQIIDNHDELVALLKAEAEAARLVPVK
jgi:hypothetical protein